MAKELIISSSAHEKKIAIVEDGVVAEYYVERIDEAQGMAGNIYKGRVMKVLPGMQSAFVNIGLERDAFLYVSDFFEEEGIDEFETIADAKEGKEVRETREQPREERRPEPPRPPQEERRPPIVAPQPAPAIAAQPSFVEEIEEDDDEVEDISIIPVTTDEIPIRRDDDDDDDNDTDDDDDSLTPEPVNEVRIQDQEVDEEPEPEPLLAVDESRPTENFQRHFEPQVIIPPPSHDFIRIQDDPEEVEAIVEPPATETAPAAPARADAPVEAIIEIPTVATPEEDVAPVIVEEGQTKRRRGAAAKKEPAKKKEKAPPRRRTKKGSEAEAAAEEAAAAATQFERIVDDEDNGNEAGEHLKDALLQHRLVDELRKAEQAQTPSIQHVTEPEVRVGSLQSQWQSQADVNLQRIVDEDNAAAAAESIPASEGESQTAVEQAQTPASTTSLPDEDSQAQNLTSSAKSADENHGQEQHDESAKDDSANDEPLSNDLATDGGESDGSDRPPSKGSAHVRGNDRRGDFSSRRGGRRRGRRGGAPQSPRVGGPVEDSSASPDRVPERIPERVPERAPERIPERMDRPERSERPERLERPDRPERPERSDRSDRPDRSERPERPERSEIAAKEPINGGGRSHYHQQPGISELLREGQEIVVQIAKEPIALKGARITSHIALPGRYLVYMPTVNHIGVSRKIPSDSERLRLKKTMLSLRDKEKPPGGFIVRTACEGHTEQELYDDMMYLVRTWQEIRRKAERTKAPALIFRELDLVERTLRDQLADDITAIRVDNELEYTRVVDFVNRFQPKLVKRVKLYTWKKPIFEEYGVQEELDKALKPRVWLRSGGYIVINQTEALVAIDVNTGKFVGRSNRLEDTITKTNIEAVKEIVRQIRLRDLGGIIVLDLIDMEERKNRARVMQALEAELKNDRSPSKVLQFNDFGLVAITRKRVRQSLERTLCSPCPYCQGAGLVKSPQTICYEILAEARRIASDAELSPGADVILRVNPEIAEALRNTEKKVFSEIEAYFGTGITIKGDDSVHQERFDFAIV